MYVCVHLPYELLQHCDEYMLADENIINILHYLLE
jgi:hypothetical protein